MKILPLLLLFVIIAPCSNAMEMQAKKVKTKDFKILL